MGWPDLKDMLQWIGWVLERDSQAQLVLHGISMGGAAVMMTAGESLPSQVKAIVEDCGYTSVWDIFADEMDYLFHLPAFPLLNIANSISSFRAGYSFSEASALKQIARAQVPVLFIHGSEDNFVHTDMVYRCTTPAPLKSSCWWWKARATAIRSITRRIYTLKRYSAFLQPKVFIRNSDDSGRRSAAAVSICLRT